MIMPVEEDVGRTPEFPARVSAFFRRDGGFEIGCGGEPFPYEHRPQQVRMAEAVAAALAGGRHLAVEAGTGVGKSFAYLAPLILAAVERRRRAIVSTCTISLQEQLMSKDIPFLRDHLGVEFSAVLAKGRSNYLCRRRLARTIGALPQLFDSGALRILEEIRERADRGDSDGSLQSLSVQPPVHVWESICAEADNCRGPRCREYRSCFLMRARRALAAADVIVANHHLLFSDLGLRAEDAGFLPEYDAVTLDEAHAVEDIAGEHFGLRLSHFAVDRFLRRLLHPDKDKGLLAVCRNAEAAATVRRLWDVAASLFDALRAAGRLTAAESQRRLASPPEVSTDAPSLLRLLSRQLIAAAEETEDDDIGDELRQSARRAMGLDKQLSAFLSQSLDDHVYWMELEGSRRQLVLHSAPIEVAPILRAALFEAVPSVIMTSATLAVNGSLDYFLGRVGAEGSEGLAVGSPFDFGRQMRLLIPDKMPDPTDDVRFPTAVARAVMFFTRASRGRAFVLFTSATLLRTVADMIRGPLERDGLGLLVQGEGLPRHRMLEEFRAGDGMVLLGLDSFWMGVDVRGDALSNVILVRLPFAAPDQPVIRARMDRIRERGGDAFRQYSLPEAVIKFRQGVGRLVRTATDTGTVVVLDRRIAGKWYGRWFARSIPECPVEIVSVPFVPLDGDDFATPPYEADSDLSF